MGRGNVCVSGAYEGLWYIDKDCLSLYRDRENEDEYVYGVELGYDALTSGRFEYDEFASQDQYDDMVESLRAEITGRYDSFSVIDRWVSNHGNRCDRRAILENELFFIALEDNEWSVAVELLQKGPEELAGLQARHYEGYLETLKKIILDLFGQVSYRNGAWMSGTIRKEEVAV